ncbi:hypothetical protein OZX65_01755 [Leuconostocaceae bacterium ESL0723]|nr:hypothetical protein OZX65_01755 [Leuconostocaceae bacterium ESL0723]
MANSRIDVRPGQPAYILVTVLVFLGLLAAFFLLQQQHFSAQLRTQQALNRQSQLENLQIEASANYWANHVKDFDLAGVHCQVEGEMIKIDWRGKTYQRPLLVPILEGRPLNR